MSLLKFINKLSAFGDMTSEAQSALQQLPLTVETARKGRELATQGKARSSICFLIDGWASQYKIVRGGGRQIVGYLLPGDLCDLPAVLGGRLDHNVRLNTDSEVGRVSASLFQELVARHPSIKNALFRATISDVAILREWATNVGRRDAKTRLAHHLCELRHRLKRIGLVQADGSFELPLTQEDLGDALGLTPVHVNRTIRLLKEEGVIAVEGRCFTLLKPQVLSALTGFNGSYLRLEGFSSRSRTVASRPSRQAQIPNVSRQPPRILDSVG